MSRKGTGGNIVFRLNAGHETGYGHLVRCMALARKLAESGFASIFITDNDPSGATPLNLGGAFEHVQLPPAHSADDEQNALMNIIHSAKPVAAVVDMLRGDNRIMETFSGAGLAILAVDDVYENNFKADIIVNSSLYAKEDDYAGRGAMLLLGPKYFMLRGEFAEMRTMNRGQAATGKQINGTTGKQENPTQAGYKKLLMSFGGSDPHKLTIRSLQALKTLKRPVELMVMVGDGSADFNNIYKLAASMPFKTEVHRGSAKPWELMAGASLAICSIGNTTWELAALGVPSVVITFFEGQSKNADALDKLGAGIHLSRNPDFDTAALLETVDMLLDDEERLLWMSAKCVELVDGLGAERVAQALVDTLSGRNNENKAFPA